MIDSYVVLEDAIICLVNSPCFATSTHWLESYIPYTFLNKPSDKPFPSAHLGAYVCQSVIHIIKIVSD